jgi:RHS repeat-associated protein
MVTRTMLTMHSMIEIHHYDAPSPRLLSGTYCQAANSTGKERDSESGLDHFQFRKSSSALGRFMNPDPAGMMAVDIGSRR